MNKANRYGILILFILNILVTIRPESLNTPFSNAAVLVGLLIGGFCLLGD